MKRPALAQISAIRWQLEPHAGMHVPVLFHADAALIEAMDDKVFEQAINVACLPGIAGAVHAMPDAHWGYGFPIGAVAAFDADAGGVVCAGGVGFDISCGVRTLHTGLALADVAPHAAHLADVLYSRVPCGVGSTGDIHLSERDMRDMLAGGAGWAVRRGYGTRADLERIEERGCMAGADPEAVSERARARQRDEMGTLGSGNHYLELQTVAEIFDAPTAVAFGLHRGDVLVSIHCGSRGLGHQIGTEYLREMATAAGRHGIRLPDRELACAPLRSELGERYLGAMRAAINCALANRQIITQLTRQVFERVLPRARLVLLYDVSHNTCKRERHVVDGRERELYVHRKGATRAFPPGHPDLPAAFLATGQPVLVGGSMGTASWILAGTAGNDARSLSSACHGAGRQMSRKQATKRWQGRQVIDELAGRGIHVRAPSDRGVAEEAPGAYKDVDAVVAATGLAGLARPVARLTPIVCIKG
ncbi:MAG: RtcB family protein [Gammaproteobacteria bacterium]|nr:RtcB family protein [Gammaproteobacteria bacterium]